MSRLTWDLNSLEIGKRVREFRKAKKLNQETLAELCQLSPSLIGQIERGEKSPSLRTIITLSHVFNVSLDRLVLGRSDMICDQSRCELYNDLTRLIARYEMNSDT